jgi:hypothetical protein
MAKARKVEMSVAVPVELSPEEMAIIEQFRSGQTNVDTKSQAHKELAEAFVEAIERTKPKEKKSSFNRPRKGPWEPKDGKTKPRLRRMMMQHGIELTEATLSSEEIELLNKVKAGSYCGGFVRVIKRKDKSIDIDYPIKTSSQRLKLVNNFGIRNLSELCHRHINEAANPATFRTEEDDD